LNAAGRNLASDLGGRVQRSARATGKLLLGPLVIRIEPDASVPIGRVRSEVIPIADGVDLDDPVAATSRLPLAPRSDLSVRISLPNGEQQSFTKNVITVGRDEDNDVVIPDSRVSRRHAEIHAADGRLEVRDLHSTNGTWVKGTQIQSAEVACPARVNFGGVEIQIDAAQT
jgi:hypothetical protein